MSDGFIQLNVGVGGEVMDEEEIVFGTSPFIRNRSRVVVCGTGAGDISPVIATSPIGTEYGLIVRNIPSGTQQVSGTINCVKPGTAIVQYGTTTTVSDNTETTIVSYIVPVGQTFYITGFTGTGDINGRYRMFVSGTPRVSGRTSVATPTVDVNFKDAYLSAVASSTIEIRITHYASGLVGEFEASIFGYLV